MADVMKAMGQAKRGGIAGALGNMFGLGGGMPQPTPEQIEALQKQMGGGALPPGAGGLPPLPPLPPALSGKGPALPGLPGLGGAKLPGLGGGFPFGGKKK
jgi:signal recognition particle subunit SRP54